MSRALVVGGSPSPISISMLKKLNDLCSYVVAVDKGIDVCLDAEIVPDLFCGDGDSLSHESSLYLENNKAVERVVYNPHKDDTDLSLAIGEVVNRGYSSVIATSLLGGRIDHQLAVVGVLNSFVSNDIWWAEDDMIGRFLSSEGPCDLVLNEACRDKTFSCISLEDSTYVTEQGARWNVDRLCLDALSDRGVSNIAESDEARIHIHEGNALICINHAPLSLIC